jgi:GH25 family lysozyme M1 (1,4-beta-N-acetylmuramidase)
MITPSGSYQHHPEQWVDGIDVAIYQHNKVDWNTARTSGNVNFAWIKSSEATFQDSAFEAHAKKADDALVLTGPYHFLRNNVDPIKQAERIASLCHLAPDLPPMLDVEDPYFDFKNPPPWAKVIELSKRIEEVAHACATEIERLTGRICVIYTGAYYFAHKTLDLALNRPLFVAQYYCSGFNEQSRPKTPLAWSDWHIWQWAGDDGRVPGVSIACDRNYFHGNQEQFTNWLQQTHTVGAKDVSENDPTNTEQGSRWQLYRATEAIKEQREDYCDEQEEFHRECFNFGMQRAA